MYSSEAGIAPIEGGHQELLIAENSIRFLHQMCSLVYVGGTNLMVTLCHLRCSMPRASYL